jgi:hypothetical protein
MKQTAEILTRQFSIAELGRISSGPGYKPLDLESLGYDPKGIYTFPNRNTSTNAQIFDAVTKLDTTLESQRRGRTSGTENTKKGAEDSRLTLQRGMMKYFAVVEASLGCKLETATADQLRQEYDRGRIAKGLWDDRRDYFETSPGEHDGVSPFELSTLESREVGRALKQLICEGEIPPEPPPRRARRK